MKKLLLILTSLIFISCTNSQKSEFTYDNNFGYEPDALFDVYDPFESLNLRLYHFNAILDENILYPASKIYVTLTPKNVRDGINNFMENKNTPLSATNALLQGDGESAFNLANRFFLNTTIGLFGIIDVAEKNQIPYEKHSFSQTLATYGVKRGPYFVIPFFGPGNMRDFAGKMAEFSIREPLDYFNIYSGNIYGDASINSLQALDARGKIDFYFYSTGSPFEYLYVRAIYDRYQDFLENEIVLKRNQEKGDYQDAPKFSDSEFLYKTY